MVGESKPRTLGFLQTTQPSAHSALSTFRPRTGISSRTLVERLRTVELPSSAWILLGVDAKLASVLVEQPLEPPTALPRAREGIRLPSTQATVFVQMGAETHDDLLEGLRALDQAVGDTGWKDEELIGGWGKEHREPFGFRERAQPHPHQVEAVTIQRGPGAGGTWLLFLRFECDRGRFLAHRERDQIAIMGAERSGHHLDAPSDDAHVAKVHGYGRSLLRRGFPYRAAGIEGLAFVAAAADPMTFDRVLDEMLGVARAPDRLLGYVEAVSGGVYFVDADLQRGMR